MTDRRYVRITYPWQATVDVSSPQPAAFFGELFQQTLRFGNPGFRRFGGVRAAVARWDLPPASAVAWLLRKGKTAHSDLDALREQTAQAWAELKQRGASLPDDAEGISLLELRRAAARTIFVFADEPRPLLVLKLPGDASRIDHEVEALVSAEPAQVAPRSLGRLGEARVQEGLDGRPMRVEPLSHDARPAPAHSSLADGLERLSATTASAGRPEELSIESMTAAVHRASLTERARRCALDALDGIEQLDVSVVKHGDTSAQNCLFGGDSFVGLVDWETARIKGAPGFDTWNAGLAIFEHGLGLKKSSEARIREAFSVAWNSSPYFDFWREAARKSARSAGVDEPLLDALEVSFFVRRLEHRLKEAPGFATGPGTAIAMLETVCAS